MKSSVTFRFAMKTLILRIFNYVGKSGCYKSKMSGERRGRGKPRVNRNVEENVAPDANMWAQMMHQNQ